MGNRKIGCVVVLGAVGVVVIAGLGTSGYAAPSDSDSSRQRPDVTSVFDPFALTRIVVAPVAIRPTNPAILMGTRGGSGNNGNGNNGNGNGKRPPVIPPRPPVRSPCRPPDSR